MSFNLSSRIPLNNNDKIQLYAIYSNYVPIVNFYESGLSKPTIDSVRYTLLEKNSDNQIKLTKIIDGNIYLEDGKITKQQGFYDRHVFF